MASNEIAKIEHPGTLDKVGTHIAPLVHWKSSTPTERAIAVGKVVGTGLVLAGGAGGAQAVLPVIQSVPYADSGLLLVGAASIVTGAATIAVHRGSETIGAAQISSSTRKVAVRFAAVAGAAAVGDLVIFRGNGVLGQIATDGGAVAGAAAVASAGASVAWARVARRAGPTQATKAPSLVDLSNF